MSHAHYDNRKVLLPEDVYFFRLAIGKYIRENEKGKRLRKRCSVDNPVKEAIYPK